MNYDNEIIGLATKAVKKEFDNEVVDLQDVLKYIDINYVELLKTVKLSHELRNSLIVKALKDKLKETQTLIELLDV